jgi:hypothetical protein
MELPKSTRRGGKKNRKFGRSKRGFCHAKYNLERRWIKNKAKRIAKQMKKFPNYKPFNISSEVKYQLDKLMKTA